MVSKVRAIYLITLIALLSHISFFIPELNRTNAMDLSIERWVLFILSPMEPKKRFTKSSGTILNAARRAAARRAERRKRGVNPLAPTNFPEICHGGASLANRFADLGKSTPIAKPTAIP